MAPNPFNPDSTEKEEEPRALVVTDRRASALERPVTPPEGGILGILRAALERGTTPELLDKMIDVTLKLEANDARKLWVAAVARFKGHAPAVLPKDKEVSFPGVHYTHASLGGILSAITPHLSQEGLSVNWRVEQTERAVTVTTLLQHEAGHFESVTLSGPLDDSGKKNRLQQVGSTISYLQRYGITAALGIGTGDVDDDGRANGAHEPERTEDPRPESKPAAKPEPKPAGPSKRATDAIARFATYGIDQGAMERDLGMLAESWSEREYDLLKVAWVAITKASPKEDVEARKAAARKVFHLGERTPGED
jgi:hypothetical protein